MLTVVSFTANGQSEMRAKDSVDIKTRIEGFYSWYIDMIKNDRLDIDFNPGFVKKEDGMTTLDFSRYEQGLRKFKFTEDFIKKKIYDFKTCFDNLASVPFDEFIKYELDEHEKLRCDFSSYYEWTGGQEPVDKIELSRLSFVDKETALGEIDFITNSKTNGQAIVLFKKIDQEWNVHGLILR